MTQAYDRQDRGGGGDYDRYLRQMDASMRQKVALTAAHLLSEGELADMGMGSGSGSHALAQLYPDLEVIGVDVNPVMVERARRELVLPNLRFLAGDVAAPCFSAGTLEAILDSSVLHHVTSFNGYDRAAAARALAVQAEQLAEHGILVVRDFVDPGPGLVWLDLPTSDGHADVSDVAGCSTAALFERFAGEFRSLLPPERRGFAFRAVEGSRALPVEAGFRRYELEHAHAVEFILRKDYRDSWEIEAQEEYCYATQAELEATCARLGLRVLASTPLRNPWIVANRFRGKFRLFSVQGAPLDWPATNVVVVGQKVPAGEGVTFVEGARRPPLGYLELTHFRHLATGRVHDLVRRPHTTVDVLPWFRRGASVHVLARRGYPRPILGCDPRGAAPLDGATPATYVTEPLNVQKLDRPIGQTVEELLASFPDIGADALLGFEHGSTYYPSPGGLQEEVESMLVEVRPVSTQWRLESASGFSTSGVLRSIEARQLLRAAQVGGLPDARLELNTYDLLLRLGMDPGEWIGEAPSWSEAAPALVETSLDEALARPHRRAFRRAAASESVGFLELTCAEFVERDAAGVELHRRALEMVVPSRHAHASIAVAVLARTPEGRVLVGLDDDDLPAAQGFVGNSELLVTPAWRVPREVRGVELARAFVRERLRVEYGLEVGALWELGGRYHPSPGVTPEVVHPLAVEVTAHHADAPSRLRFVPLDALIQGRHALRDGHLRIATMRAAHALGLLGDGGGS
ncbi:MAG: class I SAM-dependent methyltransferase [Deltaproteobacteria bacterium]|nr:class I SAM-dependent methyltransferase [Deltaproteobacteria bacterium]